ncbi:hypothetical protein MIND_00622100 [Mycena indigotica]|uniref:Uncharacterized protein n=1 Tax=Mycena indigotica TaxID=2126181 RepID=A0A8H6W5U9_9AGAR|nr:uncharacterized protein MIND_00622100 [Mycena indigotica]KAF7303916.1 hypothetical protein MIND_00622100 [Mycena indigotica]
MEPVLNHPLVYSQRKPSPAFPNRRPFAALENVSHPYLHPARHRGLPQSIQTREAYTTSESVQTRTSLANRHHRASGPPPQIRTSRKPPPLEHVAQHLLKITEPLLHPNPLLHELIMWQNSQSRKTRHRAQNPTGNTTTSSQAVAPDWIDSHITKVTNAALVSLPFKSAGLHRPAATNERGVQYRSIKGDKIPSAQQLDNVLYPPLEPVARQFQNAMASKKVKIPVPDVIDLTMSDDDEEAAKEKAKSQAKPRRLVTSTFAAAASMSSPPPSSLPIGNTCVFCGTPCKAEINATWLGFCNEC